MLPHPLTNFEIQKYYENKPKFNGVYSRNNFSKIKAEANIINLDKYESMETHWIALYVNDNTYFDSFGVEHIPGETAKFIGNENVVTSIHRIQAYNSIMWGYFWIEFFDFLLRGKSSLEYKNVFSPNDYEKNDKIILKYFH